MGARYTNGQKIREIETEIAFRRNVYRRLVRENRMSPQEAGERIAILEDILDDYQPRLQFGEPERA
jgi:hypothetical protein